MWFKVVNSVLTHWRVVVVLAALLAAAAGGALLNGWRLQGEVERARTALEAQRADYESKLASGYKASLEAYRKAIQRADDAERAADAAIRRMRKEKDQWKQAFAEAQQNDPDCAAWASGRIACPLPW